MTGIELIAMIPNALALSVLELCEFDRTRVGITSFPNVLLPFDRQLLYWPTRLPSGCAHGKYV